MIRSTTSLRHIPRLGLRTGLFATLLAGALTCAATPVAHPALAASTLRIWYATDDPTEAPVVKAFAAAFQASHPGTTVNLTTYALDDMNDKMQLALSSGNTPDLIYTTPRGPGLPTYVRAGKLLDLSSAVDGMQTFDDELEKLWLQSLITKETALAYSTNPTNLNLRLTDENAPQPQKESDGESMLSMLE